MKKMCLVGLFLELLLLAAPLSSSAEPFIIAFGGCSFSGDNAGAPLLRTGSCPTQSSLYLVSKGITELPANAFEGMEQMT